MKPKKIFFILKNYKENQLGAEKAQYNISQYFIKYSNWNVIIYCKDIEEKERNNLKQYDNVRLINKKNNFYLNLFFYLCKERPNFFFSWRWEYNFIVASVCKLKRIKNICFNHAFIFKEMEIDNPYINRLYLFLYKFLCKITFLKLIDRIFVPSHQLKNYLIENISNKLDNKIVIQYNGIRENRIQEKKLVGKIDKKNVLYVGGFQKHKGIFDLLRIAKQNPNTNFYVFGVLNTAYKNEILLKIKDDEIRNIKIKGFSDDIERVYKQFDVMIFPSRMDNFPFSIIEAMKYGLIIISTNVGELKYILNDRYNAIIFDGESFDFNELNNYDLKDISKNAQKDFKEKYTIKVYKNILDNLTDLK